jgi:hypothetical protein
MDTGVADVEVKKKNKADADTKTGTYKQGSLREGVTGIPVFCLMVCQLRKKIIGI